MIRMQKGHYEQYTSYHDSFAKSSTCPILCKLHKSLNQEQ